MIIYVSGYRTLWMPDDEYYYVGYKGQNFFFSQNLKGITRLTNRKKELTYWWEIWAMPSPQWIIEYNDGEMTLIEFFINNR